MQVSCNYILLKGRHILRKFVILKYKAIRILKTYLKF